MDLYEEEYEWEAYEIVYGNVVIEPYKSAYVTVFFSDGLEYELLIEMGYYYTVYVFPPLEVGYSEYNRLTIYFDDDREAFWFDLTHGEWEPEDDDFDYL